MKLYCKNKITGLSLNGFYINRKDTHTLHLSTSGDIIFVDVYHKRKSIKLQMWGYTNREDFIKFINNWIIYDIEMNKGVKIPQLHTWIKNKIRNDKIDDILC